MLWGENRGKWKKKRLAVAESRTQDTSGFSHWCSPTEPRQWENHPHQFLYYVLYNLFPAWGKMLWTIFKGCGLQTSLDICQMSWQLSDSFFDWRKEGRLNWRGNGAGCTTSIPGRRHSSVEHPVLGKVEGGYFTLKRDYVVVTKICYFGCVNEQLKCAEILLWVC